MKNEIVVFDQNSNISFPWMWDGAWISEQIDGPEGLFYSDTKKSEAKRCKKSTWTTLLFFQLTMTTKWWLQVDGKEHKESYEKLIFATGSTPTTFLSKGVGAFLVTAGIQSNSWKSSKTRRTFCLHIPYSLNVFLLFNV